MKKWQLKKTKFNLWQNNNKIDRNRSENQKNNGWYYLLPINKFSH
jgi:hypothetical protein